MIKLVTYFGEIPPDLLIVFLSAKFIYNRISAWTVINKYPDHMKETVQKIQELINEEIYNKLIVGRQKIVFPEIPDWILKGSCNTDFISDIRVFFEHGLYGFGFNGFCASNREGLVYRSSVNLANRVQNAKKMRKIIKENNLKMIVVPKKYLCSYPQALIPPFTFSYNHRCFVLAKKCDSNELTDSRDNSLKELATFNKEEKKIFGKELVIFLRLTGVLDFHWGNFYIKDKKFVYFDTEPFSLILPNRLCPSVPLKEAKVNLENVNCYFKNIPEADIIVTKCNKAMEEIRSKEKLLWVQIIKKVCTVAALLFLNRYS